MTMAKSTAKNTALPADVQSAQESKYKRELQMELSFVFT